MLESSCCGVEKLEVDNHHIETTAFNTFECDTVQSGVSGLSKRSTWAQHCVVDASAWGNNRGLWSLQKNRQVTNTRSWENICCFQSKEKAAKVVQKRPRKETNISARPRNATGEHAVLRVTRKTFPTSRRKHQNPRVRNHANFALTQLKKHS